MRHNYLLPILMMIPYLVAVIIYGRPAYKRFSKLYEKRTGRSMCEYLIFWWSKRNEKRFLEKYHDDEELKAAFLYLKKTYGFLTRLMLALAVISIILSHLL